MSKVFPIHTATACQLKWIWSTLYLNTGVTRSCHRTAESTLDSQNFSQFHNTDLKLQDRASMLAGQWPKSSCGYCRDIERSGGTSDRMRHLTVPYEMPPELENDPNAVSVSPTVLEVYFNNTCNLGCLYCGPELSSYLANENHKHGDFAKHGVTLINPATHYRDLLPQFWRWFDQGFQTLQRLHILGGEPFYQKKELHELFDKIEANPNPRCELNIITNLMVSPLLLQQHIDRLRDLVARRCVKKVDITCSIDCWGPQQQYVRWGLDLDQWEQNFQYLLQQKWLTVNINQTISVLTIKTMPELLRRLQQWRQIHRVGHWFSEVYPGPHYLKPHILGPDVFAEDFDIILSMMPTDTEENITAHRYMQGIAEHIGQQSFDSKSVGDLFVFLEEKDRRRGTQWSELFPWLKEQHVV